MTASPEAGAGAPPPGRALVSVGIPTYNRPEPLARTLELVAGQTYRNLEIIVSDNATPGARIEEIVRRFADADPRIKYHRQKENVGVLANTAFVLKQATGEYFTWMADDDWRAPEFVASLVAELEKDRSVDAAFCDYIEVLEDGALAPGYPASHRELFRPFAGRSRLARILSYYWQDPRRGQRNLFYSLFRKSALDALDLEKLSGGWRRLDMDDALSFALLQRSAVALRGELMCTMTVGNEKHYDDADGGGGGALAALGRFWAERAEDRRHYVQETDSLQEKVLINLLFGPKLVSDLLERVVRRLTPDPKRL